MLLVLFSEYCWHNSSLSLFPLHYQEANVHLYYVFSKFSLSFYSLTKLKVSLCVGVQQLYNTSGLSSHLPWWRLLNCWDLWTHVFHQLWATSCVDILLCFVFFSLLLYTIFARPHANSFCSCLCHFSSHFPIFIPCPVHRKQFFLVWTSGF